MTWIHQLQKALLQKVRHRHAVLVSGVLHTVTGIAFIAMFVALRQLLPPTIAIADLESSIQLLAQVLALVVGVLLLGTTVSLSSYDDAASLNTIQTDLSKAAEPFFNKFFAGGRRAHKIDRSAFRRWMIRKPQIQTLRFFDPTAKEADGWYIYRPHWDGVWYQVARSPFANSSKPDEQLYQVQALHEAAISAFTVLRVVSEFCNSESALVTPNSGTNGSRWFIESFEKHADAHGVTLPSEADLSLTAGAISLAMASEHYMREEFRKHSDNLEWSPYVLTSFQLKFNEYSMALIRLVDKLQLLRLANVKARYSTSLRFNARKIEKALSFRLVDDAKCNVAAIRSRIVTAHGAAKYFYSIKRMSILGVGISLLVLLGLLCGWPLLKFASNSQTRNLGFIVLYSAGIAALIESSWFLGRLLWKHRTAG